MKNLLSQQANQAENHDTHADNQSECINSQIRGWRWEI